MGSRVGWGKRKNSGFEIPIDQGDATEGARIWVMRVNVYQPGLEGDLSRFPG